MQLNRSEMKAQWNMLKNADKAQIDHLSEAEKKILVTVFKALEKGEHSIQISNLNNFESLNLKLRLQVIDQPKTISLLDKIAKKMSYTLGFTTSSTSIVNEVKRLGQLEIELAEVDKKILNLDENSGELFDLIDFKQNFLVAVYDDIAIFYKNLPENQEEAKPVLKRKIESLNKVINELQASDDPNKASKLHTLEKEILKNLSNMEKYHSNNWSGELNRNREVWGNTLKNTDTTSAEVSYIIQNQQKINELLARKSQIEKFLK